MNNQNSDGKAKSLGSIRRKSIQASPQALIQTHLLQEGKRLPLVVTPAVDEVNLVAWGSSQRHWIEEKLLLHGGILFRDFNISGIDVFRQFARAVSDELLEYRERSSPRSEVSSRVYTSTDYPADQPIFLHNENSYQQTWPLKIFFFCVTPSSTGGETPIADCREVKKYIPPEAQERFAQAGWMYVRNFSDGLGLSWQTVFQTDDKEEVGVYCQARNIDFEWRSNGRLRTRALRPAWVEHPKTKEKLWFNHATFFHVSTLTPAIRDGLLAEFEADDLPTNTYYGDGTPIEPEVLENLRQAYHQETILFPWQKGDVLLLDNMMVAHGRSPFTGERQIVVAMAEPHSNAVED